MNSPPNDNDNDDDRCLPPSYSEAIHDPAPAFAVRAGSKRAPASLLVVPPRRERPPPSYRSATTTTTPTVTTTTTTTTTASASASASASADEPNPLPEHKWLQRLRGPKPPPKPEGVPLELVVDRFGNRTRQLRVRSLSERIRQRAHEGTTFQVGSYYLSKMV